MRLKYFIFFCFLTFAVACQNGSVPYFNDETQCIYFERTPTYWLEAEEICMKLGGHLASIHSIFQNMFLSQQALLNFTESSSSDFWIGANDLIKAGTWGWMDGTPFDYDDWSKGQPVNISESDCGAVTMQGGKWIADDCYKTKPYVCLLQANVVTALPSIPATSTTTSKPKKCPNEWIYNNASGFCYALLQNETWINAEERCNLDGGHLASIHNIAESLFVAHLGFYPSDGTNLIWIGLYTEDNGKSWKWSDGTPFDFPNWRPGQPDNPGIENCVNIYSDATFNDFICTNPLKFICKASPS